MTKFRGLVASLITPMSENGEAVDLAALPGYIDFILERGANGLFALGTTGEFAVLSITERKAVAEAVVRHVAGRVPVILHVGAASTADTLGLIRHAREIRVDAASIVVPYYYPLDEEAIRVHYLRAAEAAGDLPLFAYNIRGAARNDISPELFARLLGEIPTLVGIKSSNEDMFQFQELIKAAEGRAAVFIGFDHFMFPALCCGASGMVSGNASAVPEPYAELYRAVASGDLEAARRVEKTCHRVEALLAVNPSLARFKTALRFRDMPVGGVRPPNRGLTAEETAALKTALEALDVI